MARHYFREDVQLREVGRGVWMTIAGGHVFEVVLVGGEWCVSSNDLHLFTARNLMAVQAGVTAWLNSLEAMAR